MSSGGDMSQFAYGMAFGIGILAIVLLVTVSCCCCLRDHSREFIPAPMALQHLDALSGTSADRGIDEATLQSYPTVLFSSVKHLEKNNLADSSDVIGGGSCSICLGEYKEGDLLRLLPVCGHLFHTKCVDPWLRLHATCPVCRRSSVGQLGQPRLESETLAVTVDGGLHSGDR